MAEQLESTYYQKRFNGIKPLIYRYSILVNGSWVKNNIIGWKTALCLARKYANDLFNPNAYVEILNIWTGEIISYQEAENRAKRLSRVNSGTT